MFTALRETDDSTSVDLSAYGRFIPGSGSQLLTIGRKHIRLFRANPYALVAPTDGSEEWDQKTKLECMFSARVLSAVQDMAIARVPLFPTADCMLLAFDDGKLSIVGISPTERSLHTVSLHSFEDDILKDGFSSNYAPPMIRADPSSRCAAMVVYGRHLAVLPFQDGATHIISYTVKLTSIDARLENVLDMTFLHGYYEPTILFLYEPLQTTAGRASIRADTCCIMGVSLNVNDRQQAVVWQMSGLPMNCMRLLPMPTPVGGAVVLGANEIIYLNQSVPPCGISLNSCQDAFTKFPLRDQKHLSLVLDASEATVLSSSRMAVASRDGDLYLVSLDTDSTHSVKAISITKDYACSIPCSLTACAPGHLFVGSRLGDSQLLEYKIDKVEVVEEGETPTKKPAIEEMDEEDRLLYGDEGGEQEQKQSLRVDEKWSWTELDRLTNIGPVLSITAGVPRDLAVAFDPVAKAEPVFDLVTGSGRAKDGALCVMHRTVRPEILSSSSIEGAEQLWAVGVREDGSHRYLIISRERSTIVLELLEEMVELERPVFIFDEQTVAAGELADGAIAVQVTSMSVCLVGGDAEQLQCLQTESNFPVVAASIADPYVALLMENGRMTLYQLETQPHVHLRELDLSTTALSPTSSGAKLTAISLYKDLSGLMNRESLGGGGRKKRREEKMRYESRKPAAEESHKEEEDLEDMLLYGETKERKKKEEEAAAAVLRKRRRVVVAASALGGEESDALDPNLVPPSHWLLVARADGRVLIYELPTIAFVYQINRFAGLQEVLTDTTQADEERERKENAAQAAGDGPPMDESEQQQKPEERVIELSLTGMGINQARPVLFAVVDDTVVAYELFAADNENDGHLAVRFRRLPLTRPVRRSLYMAEGGGKRADVLLTGDQPTARTAFIQPFERVGGLMHAVFINGPSPCFVLMGAWGGFRVQPLALDGCILSFTPFNNVNVASGFLYLAEKEQTMRVARLLPNMNYELPMATRKIPVEKTVTAVRYCLQSGVYVVATSRAHRSNRLCMLTNDEKIIESHPRPDTFVCPEIDEYAIDLYSSEDWKAVPNTGLTLEEMEVATSVEEVSLRSESTISGIQNYVAIGTINNYGEEVLIRGRIILVEIIEVVPEPGQPTSKHKMKVLYDKEQKGPVTALCASDGLLVSGMGQKIFIWQYKDGDLQGMSFLDMHYYIHSLCSVHALTLACDVFASLSLVRFQEQFKALSVASRDDRRDAPPPLTAQFIIDNNKLGFLLSDENGNLTVFNYLPREGVSGDRLNLRGAVCVGTNVYAMMRVKGHTSSLPANSGLKAKEVAGQQSTLWASLDGSIGYTRALGEKQFRRLHCLQQSMASVVPQLCGLNPRGARVARPPKAMLIGESNRNVVDMDVVGQYMHLSNSDKQDLARRLGGNKYQMMDDLLILERLTTFF